MDLPKREKNRLAGYDYSQPGGYFVTICTQDRKNLFWCTGVGAACGRQPLNGCGQIVDKQIKRLSDIYPMVQVDKYVIMPNHVHLIVRIDADEYGRPQAAPTLARVINQFKGAVTKQVGRPTWQKGYYDHIIRNQADYLRVWQYIDTNPAKWQDDCYYTEVEC